MTAQEVMAINKATHEKKLRRSMMYENILVVMRSIILILVFTWFFTSRVEISRLVYRACYSFVSDSIHNTAATSFRIRI